MGKESSSSAADYVSDSFLLNFLLGGWRFLGAQ